MGLNFYGFNKILRSVNFAFCKSCSIKKVECGKDSADFDTMHHLGRINLLRFFIPWAAALTFNSVTTIAKMADDYVLDQCDGN